MSPKLAVSLVGSPTYKGQIYIIKNEYCVRNSSKLIDGLRNTQILSDYILIFLDVVSLLTNILTNVTVGVVESGWNLI